MTNLSAALLGVTVAASTFVSCGSGQKESPMKAKVEEYASVELKSDLVNNLSDKEKELVRIFFKVGEITDELFWKQTFGDKSKLDTITDNYAKEFAIINDADNPEFMDVHIPEGESIRDSLTRAYKAFDKVKAQGDDKAIIIMHGAIMYNIYFNKFGLQRSFKNCDYFVLEW